MNPYAAPPLCGRCGDTRFVTKRLEAREADRTPCPICGPDAVEHRETDASKERYEHFRLTRWKEQQKTVGISELDLTDEELKTLKAFKENFKVSSLTALGWIEGLRYDPSKDDEFLTEARKHFKVWRAR